MEKSGRIALVTGTSSGIGAAIAKALLEDSWTVVGLSRRQVDFDHGDYVHIRVDLGDLAALRDIAASRLAPLLGDPRWRRVGLVNNAALIGPSCLVEDLDPMDLARLLAVNTVAPVFLMGTVIRHTAPATPLRIVNLSSGAAVRTLPGQLDYGCSKAALRYASMAVAEELGTSDRPGGGRPDAAVVSYSPGVVDTPMQEVARSPDRSWNQLFIDMHAQGQLQRPDGPAAEVVTFLSGGPAELFIERRFGDT